MGKKRLFTPLFIIAGMILFVGGIWSTLSLQSQIDQGTRQARAQDFVYGSGGNNSHVVSTDPCISIQNNALSLSVDVTLAQRVMSESDTQLLSVFLTNHATTATCDESISIYAPELSFSPDGSLEQHLIVPPGQRRPLSWVVAPTRPGTFTIYVEIMPFGAGQAVGLTVTNVFGLTIWQAQALSYVSGFLGTFFGPLLSFTWWYRVWKRRKKKKTIHASASPASLSSTEHAVGPIEQLLKKPESTDKSG